MTPQNKALSYQSKQHGEIDLRLATIEAQKMNKANGGAVTIYHTLNPEAKNRNTGESYSLDQMLAHKVSKRNEELSVSTNKKGVWNTIMVLEGKAPLIYYYDKDVSTNPASSGLRIPLQPTIPSGSSHYDEAIINLNNVAWTTLHVDENDSFIIVGAT